MSRPAARAHTHCSGAPPRAAAPLLRECVHRVEAGGGYDDDVRLPLPIGPLFGRETCWAVQLEQQRRTVRPHRRCGGAPDHEQTSTELTSARDPSSPALTASCQGIQLPAPVVSARVPDAAATLSPPCGVACRCVRLWHSRMHIHPHTHTHCVCVFVCERDHTLRENVLDAHVYRANGNPAVYWALGWKSEATGCA